MSTKHETLWRKCRREWVKLNPPNHQGYYVCWICHRWILAIDMELDHVIARSRAPHLRYVLTNLRPSCLPCNREKGSKTHTPKEIMELSTDELYEIF